MSMFVVSYEKEMREAFAAGRASALPKAVRDAAKIPATYDDWIASRLHSPIARG